MALTAYSEDIQAADDEYASVERSRPSLKGYTKSNRPRSGTVGYEITGGGSAIRMAENTGYARNVTAGEIIRITSKRPYKSVHDLNVWGWLTRHRWPQLAVMALEILTIVPMSDEPERQFRDAGMITNHRSRLRSDVQYHCDIVLGLEPLILRLPDACQVFDLGSESDMNCRENSIS
jgi:hypothetical protein